MPRNPAFSENVNVVREYAKWLFDASHITVAGSECQAVAKTLTRLAPLAIDTVRTHETKK